MAPRKPNTNGDEGSDWQGVIARSLAYLCLQNSDLKNDKLTSKASFLKGLGLTTSDSAGILNTTPASLNELFRQARKAKGAKSGGKKTKSSKR